MVWINDGYFILFYCFRALYYFIVTGFILQGSISDLEEILHTFGVVAVALSADSLHLFDLTCLAGGLDVFEVDLGILAEVHDGTQEVKQT